MNSLYQQLKSSVAKWPQQGHSFSYSIITVILNFINKSFLRQLQFGAIETYWYHRIVKILLESFNLIILI